VTAPLDVSSSTLEADPESGAKASGAKAVEGRSLGQIAWMRFKRDKVALGAGVVVLLLILMAVFAPLLVKLFGFPPNDQNINLINPDTGAPIGKVGGIGWHHLLGIEPVNGRDLFSRIVYGARVSFLVALVATALSVIIGTVMGVLAGFFGGWIDTVISRSMDLLLAFPLLLFAIALAAVINGLPKKPFGLNDYSLHILVLILIIGFFNWPYVGRIIRGQTLSLREKEFVEASRSLGATNRYIMFKEILPNLVAPILVYSTLIIPTNILFEAALSFLGVGVPPPTASWGGMLSDASQGYYYIDPTFMIVPGVAIFVTVVAFNLLGDGLRDALDPRAGR
jgi:peptide/nickel transport system permease protein/oligopeptide transport system permease protein